MHFIVAYLHILTTHVTVCECHAELKGYLLTYLLARLALIVVHCSVT